MVVIPWIRGACAPAWEDMEVVAMKQLRIMAAVTTVIAFLGWLMVMTPASASEATNHTFLPLVMSGDAQVATPTPTQTPTQTETPTPTQTPGQTDCPSAQETVWDGIGDRTVTGPAILHVWSNLTSDQTTFKAHVSHGDTWYLQHVGGKLYQYAASCSSDEVFSQYQATNLPPITWEQMRLRGWTRDPNVIPTATPPPCFLTQVTGLQIDRHQLSGWAIVELWSNKQGVPWGQEVRVVRINLNETWYLQDVGGKVWAYNSSCTSEQIQAILDRKIDEGFQTVTWQQLHDAGLTYDPNAPTPTPVPVCSLKIEIQLKDVGIYDLGGWAVVELWTPNTVPWGANTVVKAMIDRGDTWHLKDVAGYGWFYEDSCTPDQIKAEFDRNPRSTSVTWQQLHDAGLTRDP